MPVQLAADAAGRRAAPRFAASEIWGREGQSSWQMFDVTIRLCFLAVS